MGSSYENRLVRQCLLVKACNETPYVKIILHEIAHRIPMTIETLLKRCRPYAGIVEQPSFHLASSQAFETHSRRQFFTLLIDYS